MAQAIQKDYKYWSDLEIGLGKYTGRVKPEDEENFWNSTNVLMWELSDYLRKQEGQINIRGEEKEKETAQQMRQSLMNFYSTLTTAEKNYFKEYICSTQERIMYSFITFNYTSVIDQCVRITKKAWSGEIGNHVTCDGTKYQHSLGEVLHIHGTTSGEMVLGVNDEGQIFNREFRRNPQYKNLLIKEEINKGFNSNRVAEARDLINRSMIICVFGMSIGQTDKMWWQCICEWLQKNRERRLIVYYKRDEMGGIVTQIEFFTKKDEILKRLKSNISVDNVVWNNIKEQIYIGSNEIFKFNLVKDEGLWQEKINRFL